MRSENVYQLLAEAVAAGRGAVLVTVISASGSTPRENGAKMVVFEDGSMAGTVGGGLLEAKALEKAREALREGVSRKEVFELTPKGLGMECMGRAELFFDVHSPRLKLLIMGAGHVGLKIGQAAALAGVPYAVTDDRSEFANRERFPEAVRILVERPRRAVAQAGVDERTYVVIATRGHALDAECLAAALKTPAPYIGMMGSRSKVPATFAKLRRKGLRPDQDPRVYAPIGIDCGGKTPGSIAVSILAEVLAVHHGRTGGHMSLVPRLQKLQ